MTTTEQSLQASIDYYKTLCNQLQHALDSRIVIEQAKGLLAERYQLNVDDAFQLLRSYCRANNMKLTATASGLVAANGRADTAGPTQSSDQAPDLANNDVFPPTSWPPPTSATSTRSPTATCGSSGLAASSPR